MKIYTVAYNSTYTSELDIKVYIDRDKALEDFNTRLKEFREHVNSLLINGEDEDTLNVDETILSDTCKNYTYFDTVQEINSSITFEEHEVEHSGN